MTLGGGLASVAVEVRADALDVVDWLVLFVAAPPMLDETLEVVDEAESDESPPHAVSASRGSVVSKASFFMPHTVEPSIVALGDEEVTVGAASRIAAKAPSVAAPTSPIMPP